MKHIKKNESSSRSDQNKSKYSEAQKRIQKLSNFKEVDLHLLYV